MPLPDPHPRESEQDFVSRCIAAVVGDNTVDNTPSGRAQGAAMCFSHFRDMHKPKSFKQAPMPTPNETEADFMDRCVSMGVAEGDTQAEVTSECQMMWDMCQQMDTMPASGGGMAMGRAYSLLSIKSVNEERRQIVGMATTPQTDLMDDIVDPKGAVFNLPMPLLWMHDAKQPIGTVERAKVTDKGIEVHAQIAKVSEPGRLKDRLDEAWQSIKAGLVRGLSIGFKAIEQEPIKGTYGSTIKKWQWLELSAVTLAANQAASITMIKQIDRKAAERWAVGASRDLPINTTAAWDGPAAAERMLAAAGFNGDSPNINMASRGFLAFDSGNPKLKGSYKLPFADIVGGSLHAMASGLRAAASRLPQTSIPSDVMARARAVIDHYQSRMNPKAATGQTAKSAGASASSQPNVVKALEPDMATKKTIADQIAAFEATRAAKAARMTEIMDAAADKNETLDDDAKDEYDGLEADVRNVDDHLVRLRKMQTTNIAAAQPVEGTSIEKASASRGHNVIQVRSPVPPGIGFVRMLACKAHAQMFQKDATLVAKQQYPNNPEIELALKTGVAAGDTTTAAWAGDLVYAQNLTSEFVEFLVPQTIIGNIPGLTRVPFNIRVPRETSVISAQWVGEGQSKPMAKGSMDTVTLRWAKTACIMGFTDELARFSNPSIEMLVRNNLAKGLAKFLDEQFLDPSVTEITNVSPASITNGAANDPASGIDQAAVLSDIRQAFANLQAANIPITGCVWIMQPTLATGISMILTPLGQPAFAQITPAGGSLYGLPVIVSNSAPAGQVTLIHAPSIFLADDGGIAVDLSREASVQMDDNPTAGDYELVSAFQQNLIFVRAERYISYKRARDEAVYYITSAAYGGTATV